MHVAGADRADQEPAADITSCEDDEDVASGCGPGECLNPLFGSGVDMVAPEPQLAALQDLLDLLAADTVLTALDEVAGIPIEPDGHAKRCLARQT